MKKILFLTVALLATGQLWAGPVDVTAARETARCFVAERKYNGKLLAPISGELNLVYTEINSQKLDRAVFYVFNTGNGFVIVSGDDRAEAILAYGDQPFDINKIPCNMRAWLDTYKEQLEFLQAHQDLEVEKPSMMAPLLRIASVEPLLTAMWDQSVPYYNQCKFNGIQCLTGCPATSAAMVFHYWKYPDFETNEVPAYQCYMGLAGIPYITIPELPPVTFDWDNMLDIYWGNQYSTVQANAVATLMRYVGQAEHMEYGSNASGLDVDSASLIAEAFMFFDYDKETVRLVKKTSQYSNAEWATMIQNELAERRPIVYCATSSSSGHAFNVDGYDQQSNMYHINWGWSGSYNNYFALNAFNGNGMIFNQNQQMVIGIQPGPQIPRLKVSDTSLNMECYKGQTTSATFTLKGNNLEGDATLTLQDSEGVFSLSENTLPMDGAKEGKTYTVTFTPKAAATYTATITCSSPGAENLLVELTGNSPYEFYNLVILPLDMTAVSATSFRVDWLDNTPVENLVSYSLEVQPKPDVMLLSEGDFGWVPLETANHASDAMNYLPEGWTYEGRFLYLDGGYISPGSNGIITANFNLMGYNKVSVIVKAKNYPKSSNTELTIATSEASEKLILSPEFETYLVVLDCNNTGQVNFIAGYYPGIQSIKIYGGEIVDPEPYTSQIPVLRVEDGVRVIEGIAPELRSYTIDGLAPCTTYFYRMKAFYVNGTERAWTNLLELTLPEFSVLPGDLNQDGKVTISDVTALIDYILSGEVDAGIDVSAGDCDQNGSINISDVTALIDYILNGTW